MIDFECTLGGRLRRRRGFLGFLVAVSAAWPVAAGEPTDSAGQAAADPSAASSSDEVASETGENDLATARLHFKNGVELLQARTPNYQDAYRQFELAFEHSGQSWKVLGNLGLCALKLERDGEALEFYRKYLEQGGDEIDPEERRHIERELLLIQGSMAHVTIESSVPGVRISVSREGSSAPTQLYRLEGGKGTLGLRAGTLTITARSPGRTLVWKPSLTPEESAHHIFDFSAQSQERPKPSEPATKVQSPGVTETTTEPSMMRIVGFATAGAGALALGGGLAAGLISQSKETEARGDCIDDVCPESAKAEFESAENVAQIANILLIGGGVLAATGITLVIVGGSEPASGPEDTALFQLSPLVASGGGGLAAFGRF